MPSLVILLVIAALFDGNRVVAVVAVAALFRPVSGRIFHAPTLQIRNEAFVEVARSYGASDFRILVYHVAPNVSSLILVVGTLYLGGNALLHTSSSFLGVISSEYPDWGTILNTSSAQNIVSAAWLVIVHLVGLGNAPGATGRPAHSARGIDPGQRQTAQCNRLQSAVNHSRTARRPTLHANVKNTCTNRRRVDAIESESKQLEAAAADRGHGTARGDRPGDPGLARGADPGSDLGSSGILMPPTTTCRPRLNGVRCRRRRSRRRDRTHGSPSRRALNWRLLAQRLTRSALPSSPDPPDLTSGWARRFSGCADARRELTSTLQFHTSFGRAIGAAGTRWERHGHKDRWRRDRLCRG